MLTDKERKQVLAIVGAILSTIYEVSPNDPIPASSIYLALGMNLQQYEYITNAMVSAGLIIKTSSTIAITDSGKAKALELTTVNEIA